MAPRRLAPLWAAALAGFVGLPPLAAGSDAGKPHPHEGRLERFHMDGKPKVSLSGQDLAKIDSGALYTSVTEEEGVGKGIGIQDIAAPPDVIFGQIADLGSYVGKVPTLRSCNVYSSKKVGGPMSSEVVEKASYLVRVVPGYNLEYYVEHIAAQSKNTLVFFLDYSRYSDIDDLMGKWYLEEHPTRPGWTRLYYQCYVKPWGYIPSVVRSYVTKSGLTTAVGWVKLESERRAPRTAGGDGDSAPHPAPPVGGASAPARRAAAAAVALLCVLAAVGRLRQKRRAA